MSSKKRGKTRIQKTVPIVSSMDGTVYMAAKQNLFEMHVIVARNVPATVVEANELARILDRYLRRFAHVATVTKVCVVGKRRYHDVER